MDLCFRIQNLIDTVSRDHGTRKHNEDHGDHHEGHYDLGGVDHKRHQLAEDRDPACSVCRSGNYVCTDPVNRKRSPAHHELDGREQIGHDTAGEQMVFHSRCICAVKFFFLVQFSVVGSYDPDAGKVFPCHTVQIIGQDLDLPEFRDHKDRVGDQDRNKDQDRDAGHDQPLLSLAHDFYKRPDRYDRRFQHRLKAHGDDHDHLRHVVGHTGQQGGRGKLTDFFHGESSDLPVQTVTGRSCKQG